MNLPALAHSRLYAPLLAVWEAGRSKERAGAQPRPAESEPVHDDFEDTRPMWFINENREASAASGGVL